jgi:hypothetical protein
MAVTFNTKYPKELTNTVWQKNKLSKEKGNRAIKTGLGATLTKAEKAWNAIKFKDLDAKYHKPKTLAAAKTNIDRAKLTINKKVVPAITALEAAYQQAEKTAKLQTLTPKAREAALNLVPRLKQLRTRLKGIKLKDFDLVSRQLTAGTLGGQAIDKLSVSFIKEDDMGRDVPLLVGSSEDAVLRKKDNAVYVKTMNWSVDYQSLSDDIHTAKFIVAGTLQDGNSFRREMFMTPALTGNSVTFKP